MDVTDRQRIIDMVLRQINKIIPVLLVLWAFPLMAAELTLIAKHEDQQSSAKIEPVRLLAAPKSRGMVRQFVNEILY